jgi:hypothetical protein
MDEEYPPACSHCGGQMDWADCWMIDCEEGYYDLHEQDCINYDPGTYAKCSECEGKGGWWYCPSKECKPVSASEPNT